MPPLLRPHQTALAVLAALALSGGALAAVARASRAVMSGAATGPAIADTGYDVSYPQCGAAVPSGQAFGIAGVNGGLANDPNPCLAIELAWALTSSGLRAPAQPPASLYIDTADPGPTKGVTDWPDSGRAGWAERLGSCAGTWSEACAYVYGRGRAAYSYGLVQAINPALAAHAPWWLDVETSSSWATARRRGYQRLNRAAIRGFIAGLHASGATKPVGVYSFPVQWREITGLAPATTRAALGGAAIPGWIGGTGGAGQAQRACATRGFTGTRPVLAQYRFAGYDADVRCAAASRRHRP